METNTPQRFPLVLPADNRDSTTSKDAKLVNCYVERNDTTGDYSLFKRAGLLAQSTVAASTTGLGVFNWNGDIYSCFGTTFYKNGVSQGTIDGANGIYKFTSVLGPSPYLVFTNGVNMYTYNNTNGLQIILLANQVSTNGQFTTGSKVVTAIPSTTGMNPGDAITGQAIPLGTTIATVDSGTQITMSANATQTSIAAGSHSYAGRIQPINYPGTSSLAVFNITGTGTLGFVVGNSVLNITDNNEAVLQASTWNGINIAANGIPGNVGNNTIVQVTGGSSIVIGINDGAHNWGANGGGFQYDISFSTTTIAVPFNFTTTHSGLISPQVKGVVNLDTTVYQMDAQADIYGSNLNDVTTWNPLNKLTSQIEPDGGVALAKQLSYVIAFKQWTTEVFYDAANATGSPLSVVQGANPQYGCATATSVCRIDGVLYWVSTTKSGSLGIHKMENLQVTKISTKSIDRLISDANTSITYSFGFKDAGHIFYVVTFKNSNLTLAYDIIENQWAQWTDSNGNYFPIVDATFLGTNTLAQHESNGKLYYLQVETFTDDGALITVDAVTPNFDAKVKLKKILNRVDVVADQVSSSLQIRNSDDDYKTWSNFRLVDLSKKNAYLTTCGSFYKRAYHIRHKANTALRLQGLELQMELGTI